jgi:hypothetical protein
MYLRNTDFESELVSIPLYGERGVYLKGTEGIIGVFP